ncbi:MAG: arginine ABC transporter, periplasmic arginine-binding protein [uncultured bacterium]|nr:MAG: arginine ABC transporter, periplasmic arginine-binding protein [uncultured bacterium]
MNKKNLLLSCVSALLLISNISYAKIKTIRFALEATYAPFSATHADKELDGFDVDIAKEICKRLKAQCTFRDEPTGNMIPLLKAGKYDAWIGAITVTEERKKEIAFSDVYLSSTAKLMAAKNSTFNAAHIEIKGKTIGVEAGTSYIPYIEKMYGKTVKIQTFPTGHDSCQALKDGKVDAVIDDELVLKHWRLDHGGKEQYRLIGLPAKHLSLIKQQYAIAVAKDNITLVKEIDRALSEMKADGTYAKIIKKHF